VTNPFTGIYFDRNKGVKERVPIPISYIRKVQTLCKEMDDDIRWAVAIASDTGMRLAEIIGLALEDIVLDNTPYPHLIIQEHPWRRLKNLNSGRLVPLVGSALWVARRIKKEVNSNIAFSRYLKGSVCNSNSASAALNKWLKSYVPSGCSMHSFRHSIRDRLRDVECPSDILDQIGGWSSGSVGINYGRGYNLNITSKWMNKLVDET
jgi:integrase